MSKRYWCPTCGDLESFVFLGIANAIKHRDGCTLREIPVVEPLDVPEVTTWGESGGAEVVTCMVDDSGDPVWHLAESQCDPFAIMWMKRWFVGDFDGRRDFFCDVVTAINYVAGVTP